MRQGQLCKIQARKNQDPIFAEMLGEDLGWFLKAKHGNRDMRYHRVDGCRISEMTIDPIHVDDPLHNHDPTKPYYVVRTASTA